MTRFLRCFAPAVAALLLAACADETADDGTHIQAASNAVALDTNGDGRLDGIDFDGDGAPEMALGETGGRCNPVVDTDGDGRPDGLDFDCDGTIDVDLPEPRDTDDRCHPRLIDDDGDRRPDGIDLDCDGDIDVEFPEPGDPSPGPGCRPQLVDDDGDGRPDGIDIDCDGEADHRP